MAVSNEVVKQLYTGTGSNTTFAIPFDFKTSAEIVVVVRDESVTPATETTQSLGVDYTLTGSPATDVEFIVAPLSTDKVLVKRSNPLTQDIDYNGNSQFPAESHEDGLDKIIRVTQELDEVIDRAVKMKQTLNGFDPTVPDPDTGASVLSVNAGLTGLEWRDFTTTDAGLATQSEAEIATNNAAFLSPLRGYQQNTARLANQAEAEAGTDNDKLMTPFRGREYLDARHSLENVGLAYSVNAGALTINLKQANGSAPSTTGPVHALHTNVPTTSASFRKLSYIADESITIPSGATLGYNADSGFVGNVYVYSIYDGTNLEIAVSTAGAHETNDNAVATTLIDTNSDTDGELYSTTARTGCTIKLLGRLRWDSFTSGGTWAAPDHVLIGDFSTRRDGYLGELTSTINWDNATIQTSYSLTNGWLSCLGMISFTGAPTTGNGNITLPSGFNIDARRFRGIANPPVGQITVFDSGVGIYCGYIAYANATDVTAYVIDVSGTYAARASLSTTVPITFANNDAIRFNFTVPIKEY